LAKTGLKRKLLRFGGFAVNVLEHLVNSVLGGAELLLAEFDEFRGALHFLGKFVYVYVIVLNGFEDGFQFLGGLLIC
jgi:hypothetical protein